MLLEAGTVSNLLILSNIKKDSFLNIIIYNVINIFFLKSLFNFGADINLSKINSNIAFIYAVWINNVNFVLLFLKYSININVILIINTTFLIIIITYKYINLLEFN